ncbi:VanZ family protein [Dehalobacter sp. CF]|uniref:VanZ family protein n=1 Tax=Dehalobacter sp. CF TaxID=1131462 RepID=UPI00028AC28B|nr:VanZ family protein [Dehalobacter sp. CF]AFV05125.1 hypothetical protein DCF50_p1120 [Dehalobacter sp. CF]
MKNKISKKRLVISIFLLLILIALMMISWKLSDENGMQSNDLSMKIAKKIEYGFDNYFDINHKDTFWKTTFNQILRKVAHFIEYAVIGSVMCLMFNAAIRKAWVAALISIALSPAFGLIDEYHQMFSPMRTPRLLDVYIDTTGILFGVIIVTVFFLVFNYIMWLKYQIRELEKKYHI